MSGAGPGRVVVLVDMDCFYCQVEAGLEPEWRGKPLAVVQYNPWRGGGIIAVNYEARARGVTRHMRGEQAREVCPDIILPSVPCVRGKADITKYRTAGERVARVLQRYTSLLERASIDEAYLDITAAVQERLKSTNIHSVDASQMPNTYALGYDTWEEFVRDAGHETNESLEFEADNARGLLVGAMIVSEIRRAVFEETGYECSAGIAHNKILAKLVCGMNKPNKQTLLPKHCINILYSTLSVKKVKHLGGKFGDTVCEVLKIKNMGELQRFSEKELQSRFDEKNGTWLYNIARGVDTEPVQAKFNPKSIGCCKQFKGKAALLDLESVKKWLKDLGDEIEERLEKDSLDNNRTARQMVVSFITQFPDGRDVSSSRSYNFMPDDVICGDFLFNKSLELLMESTESTKPKENEDNRKLKMPVKFLGISVGKFEDKSNDKKVKKIIDFFSAGTSKQTQGNAQAMIDDKNIVAKEFDIKVHCSNSRNKAKETIFQKYFQSAVNRIEPIIVNEIAYSTTDSALDNKTAENNNFKTNNIVASPDISTTLDKQESFFQRFINNDLGNKGTIDQRKSDISSEDEKSNESVILCTKPSRSNTPSCNFIQCNDDSNSNYSGSTIDMEINKSITLFENSPDKSEQIDKIRSLLNGSIKLDDMQVSNSDDETSDDLEPNLEACERINTETFVQHNEGESNAEVSEIDEQSNNLQDNNIEVIVCPECSKTITAELFVSHSDFHLAVKLREEEREERRKRVAEFHKNNKKVSKKVEPADNKEKIQSKSIKTFFSKVDDNVPTEACSECGKKVPIEQLSEHFDFHEAQKLSREINKKISPFSKFVSVSTVKRKRVVSPVRKQKKPCASIDSFFT